MRGFQILLVGLSMVSLSALAAPKADLWERWTAHDPASTASLDHSAWDALLSAYIVVDADHQLHRFRYGSVSKADRRRLDDYLDQLQAVVISGYNREQQRAFWINLYNAATVSVILEHYPVESILEIRISPGLFSTGPWGKKLLTVEGEPISLDDIEHRILRPIWRDPLIHYTVNCASVGCPNLATQAYTATNYAELANANARAYVNSPRGATLIKGKLQVSSIYQWFKGDFGGRDAGVIEHLREYAEPALAAQLAEVRKISKDFYDWRLNEAD